MPKQGSDKRQRSKVISIRLLPGEGAELERRAKETGHSIGAYSRAALLGAAGPRARRQPFIAQEQYVTLLGQLGKIGSNLNQLAHHANVGGGLPAREVLEQIQGDMMKLRGDLLTALGR